MDVERVMEKSGEQLIVRTTIGTYIYWCQECDLRTETRNLWFAQDLMDNHHCEGGI